MNFSQDALAEPSSAPAQQVRLGMLHELFVRNRDETLIGLVPILLLVWSHYHVQPLLTLLLWGGCLSSIQIYRRLIAVRFLSRPDLQAERYAVWLRYEWFGVVALATGWVSSVCVLDTGAMDTLFYLRLIFLIGLVTFLHSSIGIEQRLYISLLLILISGTLSVLYAQHPDFPRDYPVIPFGFTAYGFMLLARSRGEYRRTREWVTARLNRRLLLAQLNAALIEERDIKEQLRQQSQELENRNRELSELAVRDGLTRAFRRGHIEGELRRLIKGLQRRHDDFCVLMMDIDFFKRVNDEYGHAVGDEVLRRLAATSQIQLRETDLFGRWGGEEFIVLMPQTKLADAVEAAQRLRHAIDAMVFELGDATFQITISIGAAQLQPQESADALVARADEALYAAKHAGRNCVRAAPVPAPALMAA